MTDAAWHPDPTGAASWRWWDGAAWGSQTAPARTDLGFPLLRELAGRSLVVDRDGGGLVLDGAPVALIGAPSLGDSVCECAEGSWSFDRTGLTGGSVVVRVLPAGLEVGRFDWRAVGPFGGVEGTDGTLFFPDGRAYALRKTDEVEGRPRPGGLLGGLKALGSPSWTFVGGAGNRLVTADWQDDGAIRVDIDAAARDVLELPLLVLAAAFLAWAAASSTEARRQAAAAWAPVRLGPATRSLCAS